MEQPQVQRWKLQLIYEEYGCRSRWRKSGALVSFGCMQLAISIYG